MNRHLLWILVGGCIGSWGVGPVRGDEASRKLAARIDREISTAWSDTVKPAPLSDDAEFLRRISLDLAGRIPPAFEVRDFLDDTSPNKRERLVEQLLQSPQYVNHFTNVWRATLLPYNSDPQRRFLTVGFEAWLRRQLQADVSYDSMVREILTGSPAATATSGKRSGAGQGGPEGFFVANELKPETLGAAVSRLFLGVKIECAQCHDHPSGHWSRQQFWEFAAFFSSIPANIGQGIYALPLETPEARRLKIPGLNKTVEPHFLDGKAPRWQPGTGARTVLASWMLADDNPYFARNIANRMWAHFFGIGLVDPVDDVNEQNPPSHPALLGELARQLVSNHYDLKFLIRAITASQTYQRSSRSGDSALENPRSFARMAVRGLTPDQLFDNLVQATGYQGQVTGQRDPFMDNTPRGQFIARFTSRERATEFHTSILQALSLMNGRYLTEATSLRSSEILAAVADARALRPEQRVESLYLAALTRKPRPDELSSLAAYVAQGGARGSQKDALADVFWALLNSAEFMLNH